MLEETIIARATPAGFGGLGIVRISGKRALAVAGKIFQARSGPKKPFPVRRPIFGAVRDIERGSSLDEAFLTFFKARRSCTREAVVELSVHGSPAVLESVVRAGMKAGARLARPGEFTLRAYLNGRLDMLQAEAVNIMMPPSSNRGVVLLANATGFEQLMDLDQVTRGVASLLEGKAPAAVVTPWQLPFLYWSIMLVPFLQILGIAYAWRRWRKKGIGHVLLTMVLYGGIAFAWLAAVAGVMATPIFPGIRDAYPDIFYPLMTAVILGIGWSVLYALLIIGRGRTPVGTGE